MSTTTEIKEITSKKEVKTHYICDSCKSKVEVDKNQNPPESWYSFNSNHQGWGNDSIESYKYYDVCSGKCYIDCLILCVEELELDKKREAEIDGKSWFFANDLIKNENEGSND